MYVLGGSSTRRVSQKKRYACKYVESSFVDDTTSAALSRTQGEILIKINRESTESNPIAAFSDWLKAA